MRRVGWVSVAGGAFMIFICAAFFLMSFQYPMGTLSRMSPGLFPAILGAVGVLVGIALVVSGVFKGADEPGFESVPLRGFFCTLVAIGGFALLIRSAGLLPAVFVSTGVAALADPRNKLLTVLILAVAAAALVWLVFVQGLGLSMPLIRGVL